MRSVDNDKIINDILVTFARMIKDQYFVIDKSNVKMVERTGVLLHLNPMRPVIDVGVRRTNLEYTRKEIGWYESQSRSIKGYVDDVAIWKQVADKDDIVNSNYGWCIFSKENGSQFVNVVHELVDHPASRRASMIYTRPSMWTDATENGRNDFMCTWGVQVFIRNGCLEYQVMQRSCDMIFGFFNDFYWHCYVYNLLLETLRGRGMTINPITMDYFINSLHVYERHFPMLEKLL